MVLNESPRRGGVPTRGIGSGKNATGRGRGGSLLAILGIAGAALLVLSACSGGSSSAQDQTPTLPTVAAIETPQQDALPTAALTPLAGGAEQPTATTPALTPLAGGAAQAAPTAPAVPGNAQPVRPNIGSDIPLTYFGPPASGISDDERSRALVGPALLLQAGTVDKDAFTVTLPLYRGQTKGGDNVWYILTDTNDKANAAALGLNFSSKLTYANVGKAVRTAHIEKDTSLTFDSGSIDFSPERSVEPGDAPNAFPPKSAKPGSVGDGNYSPYIRIDNAGGYIYNAPVIAQGVNASDLDFCNGNVDYSRVHDRVVKICPDGNANGGGTVTLQMTPIFSFGKPASYISTDASDPVVATLDKGTFAPAMADIGVGRDDSFASAIERLFVTANGPAGADNPQRQGLNSALTDLGTDGKPLPPLHVIGGIPTVSNDYSPAWDLNVGRWTQEAIDKGYRSRVMDEFTYLNMVKRGFITGPDGKPFGSTGIIVNCPIVMRFL